MELAAIATAAVPGLSPVGVGPLADDADDFDSALVRDAQQNQWRVRAPRHDEASMRLETELAALRAFTPGVRAALPFRIPSVAGTVRQGSLRTFVYNHLDGHSFSLEELVAEGGTTAANVGRAIAEIHGLDDELVERADLPSYSSDQFRQRRLNALDQAATTGKIPSRLLRRWEHALEDVSLWRFNPTVVHGDLHEDHLLINQGNVTAVTGWTDLHVGDPADDLAWLAAAHEQSFSDAVYEAYVEARGEKADPHLMRRAALSAEFALAQWLVKAVAAEDEERIDEASSMLKDLDEDIAEYGGQPISVVEPPRMDSAPSGSSPDEADDDVSPDAAKAPAESGSPRVSSAVIVLDNEDDDPQAPAEREQPATDASAPAEDAPSEAAPESADTESTAEPESFSESAPEPESAPAAADAARTDNDTDTDDSGSEEADAKHGDTDLGDTELDDSGQTAGATPDLDDDSTSAIPVIQLPTKRDD